MQAQCVALGSRSLTEISYAMDYTIQLALRECAIANTIHGEKEDKDKDELDDEFDGVKNHGSMPLSEVEEKRVSHLWHFLLCGRQLKPGAPLHAPPEWVDKMDFGAASWFDQRVTSKSKQLTAQLIDLRRLHQAIQDGREGGEAFVAPAVASRFSRPAIGAHENAAAAAAAANKPSPSAGMILPSYTQEELKQLQVEDCGVCRHCQDKPKFGGPGSMKQQCERKRQAILQAAMQFMPSATTAAAPAAAAPAAAEGASLPQKEWGIEEDTELLLGVYKHGFANWEALIVDKSFPRLSQLILPAQAIAKATQAEAAALKDEDAECQDLDSEPDEPEAPAPAPAAAASSDPVWMVEPRALAKRLKQLLERLPIAGTAPADAGAGEAGALTAGSGSGGAVKEQGHEGPLVETVGLHEGASVSAVANAAAFERWVLSLYPSGFDRSRYLEGNLDKDDVGAPSEQGRRPTGQPTAKQLEKMEEKAARAAARQAALQARVASAATKAHERQLREDARQRGVVEKYLGELLDRVARQVLAAERTEERRAERAQREAEAAARRQAIADVILAREAEALAKKKEFEDKRAKKAAEEEQSKSMRHMLKVRALEERNLVHLHLAAAPAKGGGGKVAVRLTLAERVEGPTPLSDGIARLMKEYDWTNKNERFKKGHRWFQLLDSVQLGLQANVGEAFAVRSSAGCGGWAKVPWIAVSHPSESTQAGLYLQYLFRADMSGVYLCLGQGTSKLKAAFGGPAASKHLLHVASFVREKCRALAKCDAQFAASGFDLSGNIELRSGVGGLGGDYERACIICRFYDYKKLPPEAELLGQLQQLMRVYTTILDDDEYISDIKGPIEEQLAAIGGNKRASMKDLKEGAAKSRRMSLGGNADEEEADTARDKTRGPARCMPEAEAEASPGGEGLGQCWRHPACTKGHRHRGACKIPTGAAGASARKGKPNAWPRLTKAEKEALLDELKETWPTGTKVEIQQTDASYFAAWFVGEVMGHKAPDKLVIKYDELLAGAEGEPLTPLVANDHAVRARPLPEPHADPKAWAASLAPKDMVQLYYLGGYWDMCVANVTDDGDGAPSFTVRSLHFKVEHTVKADRLRPCQEWKPTPATWCPRDPVEELPPGPDEEEAEEQEP